MFRSIKSRGEIPLLLILLLVTPFLRADSLVSWTEKVHEIHLKNGMKFLIYPRGEAPIFSAYIRFRAGGIDEEEGKTGIAHFLEHMAFKGTKTIGTTDFAKEKPVLDKINQVGEALAKEYAKKDKADLKQIQSLREDLRSLHQEEEKHIVKEAVAKLMEQNGGDDYNATTSKDMTSYFVSMPSDKLRFWAELESERIFKPVFREFYEEKDVVLEERRMRVDNDPDGRLYEAFLAAAFQKSPYRWPTIGSREDVLALTMGDLEEFWRKNYNPWNAVGVLVGKIEPEKARKILDETFGEINFGQKLPPPSLPKEPPQKGERRVALTLAARPRLWVGYHKPTLPEADDYIFDLLNQILGQGRSSRLYRSLVLEKKVATDAETSSGLPGSRLPNLFVIETSPLEGDEATLKNVLALIDQEIERIQKEGVTQAELQKAKNRLMVEMVWDLKTNEGMASSLSYFDIVANDWRYLADYLKRIDEFRPEDVQRVARTYFQNTNRTVVSLKPSKD